MALAKTIGNIMEEKEIRTAIPVLYRERGNYELYVRCGSFHPTSDAVLCLIEVFSTPSIPSPQIRPEMPIS
jgi:hypothetical protein